MPTATDTPTKAPVRYYVNGKRRGDTLNKFGNIAYFNTKGIDGKDRITTKELKALLASLGVPDHQAFPWEVTLPNGTVLAAKADDGQSPTGEVTSPDRTQARDAAADAQDTKPTGPAKATGKTAAKPSGKKVNGSRVGPSARKAAVKAAHTPPGKSTAKKATAKKATASERAKAGVTPRPKRQPTRAN